MRPKKIDTMKGILCRDISGKVFIRTTLPDGSDRDYRVDHCDLDIEVKDNDAYAYELNGEWSIDYGPDTLGLDHAGNVSPLAQQHQQEKQNNKMHGTSHTRRP